MGGIRAKITSKGQITIPLEVRNRLGVAHGDSVEFVFDAGRVFVSPIHAQSNPFRQYAGHFGEFSTLEQIEDFISDLRDEE